MSIPPNPSDEKPSGIKRRGFGSMSPERQREIASMGGKASHRSGNAHQFTSEEARAAGKKSRLGKADSRVAKAAAKLERAALAERQAVPRKVAIASILKDFDQIV